MYDDNNIFAKIIRGEMPAFKVFEDERTVAFMDAMPQSDGHTLVVPKARARNLFDIEPAVLAEQVDPQARRPLHRITSEVTVGRHRAGRHGPDGSPGHWWTWTTRSRSSGVPGSATSARSKRTLWISPSNLLRTGR